MTYAANRDIAINLARPARGHADSVFNVQQSGDGIPALKPAPGNNLNLATEILQILALLEAQGQTAIAPKGPMLAARFTETAVSARSRIWIS
jgi:hypothetical protein